MNNDTIIFRVESQLRLKNGKFKMVTDTVATRDGILGAANKVIRHHLKLQYRDLEGRLSGVDRCVPRSATEICRLTM